MTDPNMAMAAHKARPSGAINVIPYDAGAGEPGGAGGQERNPDSYIESNVIDNAKPLNPLGSNAEHAQRIQVEDPMTGGPTQGDEDHVDISLHQTFTDLMNIRHILRQYVTNSNAIDQRNLMSMKERLEVIEANTLNDVFQLGGVNRLPAGETILRQLDLQNRALFQKLGVTIESRESAQSRAQQPQSMLTGDQIQAKLHEPNDETSRTTDLNDTGSVYGINDPSKIKDKGDNEKDGRYRS